MTGITWAIRPNMLHVSYYIEAASNCSYGTRKLTFRVLFIDIIFNSSFRISTLSKYRFLFINIQNFTRFCTSTLSIYWLLFIDIVFYTSFRISIWIIFLKFISKSCNISLNIDIKITRCSVRCRKVDITHVNK